MNLLASYSSANRKYYATSIAIVACAMMVLPGCGIPKLRHAMSGPKLPADYNTASNWGWDINSWHVTGSGQEVGLASIADTVDKTADTEESLNIFSDEFCNIENPFENYSDETSSPVVQTISFKVPAGDEVQTASLNQKPGDSKTEPVGLFEVDPLRLNVPDVGDDGQDMDTQEELHVVTDEDLELAPLPDLMPIPAAEDPHLLGTNSAQLNWMQFFNDPMLICLIEQALVGNQELRILNEEIQIASNEVMSRRGEYLPFVNLGLGAGVEKSSEYTTQGAVEDQLTLPNGDNFPDPLPDFMIAANIKWEVDIWKKLRNSQGAAALRFLGTQEGRNYIVTRLVAEIAEDYYKLLALDNRLEILDKTIEIQERSLEIAIAKKVAGRGTELAVQRFQAEVRKNQSMKLIIQQEIVEVENKINFNVGRYPQHVDRISTNYIDLNLHALSAGVPAQLLQNRYDIREAERELAAANLDIKVARARFYPSLGITAGVGYQAINPKYLLLTPESLIYNVAGDLVAPLINKKAIRAEYLSANSRQLQSVYNYQRTVLDAYTEVINRIAKVENYGKSIEIKKQQLAALEASVESANQLFQNARAEYVEVLLAQREMMEARMVIVETKQEQLSAMVSAYQALGGGGSGNFGTNGKPGLVHVKCQ